MNCEEEDGILKVERDTRVVYIDQIIKANSTLVEGKELFAKGDFLGAGKVFEKIIANQHHTKFLDETWFCVAYSRFARGKIHKAGNALRACFRCALRIEHRPDQYLHNLAAFSDSMMRDNTNISIESSIIPFLEYLHKQNVHSLYYLTSIANLGSIWDLGILCQNLITEQGLNQVHEDISEQKYQDLRTIFLGRFNINVHDFVPLFFWYDSPMFRNVIKRGLEPTTAILEINPAILSGKYTRFSDMNCACNSVNVYSDLQQLTLLNWDVIFQRKDPYVDENKHIRGAESLIPLLVSQKWIQAILVYDNRVKTEIIQKFKSIPPSMIRVRRP